ncbi:unnamed protein product [Brassicogethes aeneus]|uniref:Uncharacterized protein n=1 Tax=Brassicogethes aeneus TaxID=1431903 RepID=A0A9P0B380_BRAAE|nr:unnamed protein product [Brassicogethes aeneus]
MAAIVCPEKDEAERRTKVLCKLRDLIEKAEQDIAVGVRQIQVPGSESPPPMEPTKFDKKSNGPPDVMVCYKLPSKNASWDDDGIPLSNSKSRELRGGQLFLGCYCCKKNGLQDDCPRAECQGSPPCLTKPPTCGPFVYCDAKHLQAKAAKFLARGKENPHEQKMKYKCFPATVKPPEVPCCITTCIYDS